MANTLKRELAAYRRELPRLLSEGLEGQWVLVREDELTGVFPSSDVAMAEGYDRYGRERFFVHQIAAYEKPKFFTRDFRCPS